MSFALRPTLVRSLPSCYGPGSPIIDAEVACEHPPILVLYRILSSNTLLLWLVLHALVWLAARCLGRSWHEKIKPQGHRRTEEGGFQVLVLNVWATDPWILHII